ncbi:WAT1-related protein At1g43650-like [Coffea arabica]|uniref:WAT1-related protein n=1 Tax=Coffea arabica TaxID=13443 RepID=A0A6P6UPZ6_COFAR|nr:WAT1-related protein At1g43650-like isoform X1 [Coffea arabica]
MMALQYILAAMEKHKPCIVMVIIQFIYTGMSLFSKAAIAEGMKPSIFVAYRQALATLALAPFAIFFESQKSHPLSLNVLCKMFLVSLCGVTLSLNLYYAGMNYTSATFATAMTNNLPIIVFIMAVCLRIESLSITQWHGMAKVLGAVTCLSGAMVITFYKGPALYSEYGKEASHNSSRTYTKEEWIKGSLLMLGANLTWAIWLIMQAPILKQYPAKLRLTTLQCCFSCVISTVYSAAVERNISSWKLGWDVNLFSVAYCGIVVTGLSYWLQVWVVEKRGPVFTSIFSPIALLLTAIFSAMIFKETLHCGSVLGAVLLVAGLYSFLWGKNKETEIHGSEEKSNQTKEEVALECITCTPTCNEDGEEKR